jgi:hypothetical protein
MEHDFLGEEGTTRRRFFVVVVVGLGCARTGEGLNFLFFCSEASAHIHTLIINGLRRLVLVITAIM